MRRQALGGGAGLSALLLCAAVARGQPSPTAPAEPRSVVAALPPEDLARQALEDHPDVIAAKARLEEAKAEEDRYRVGDHEVELQVNAGPRDVQRDRTYHEESGQVLRAFRWPGKARLDRQTGAIGVKAAADEVDDARHQTGLTLADAWFTWIRASAQAELDRQTVDGTMRGLAAMKRRVQLKDAAPLELDQSASALDQARARAATSEGAAKQAMLTLAKSFPDLPLPAHPPTLPDPVQPAIPSGGWHDTIIARSHEIRIAQYKADEQRTIAARARMDQTPDPTFGVRLSNEYGGRERTAQLVFSIPFGGRYRSATTARETAAASDLQAQAVKVAREIDALADQDVAAVETTLTAWRAAHDALATADSAAHRMQRAYELGEKDLSETLITNAQLYEARRSEIEARAAAWNAHVKLLLDSHSLWADAE